MRRNLGLNLGIGVEKLASNCLACAKVYITLKYVLILYLHIPKISKHVYLFISHFTRNILHIKFHYCYGARFSLAHKGSRFGQEILLYDMATCRNHFLSLP
jgi:hypothetical protein